MMEFYSASLLYIIILCYFEVHAENLKCSRQISENEVHWFCCNNHEDKNGTCVECETGYVSRQGSPCHPCSDGTFGRKCGDICECKEHQRCDHIIGCTESAKDLISTLYSSNTNFGPDTTLYIATTSVGPESTIYNEIKLYSSVYTTVDAFSRSTTDLQIIIDKSPGRFSGLLKREIVIYSVTSSVFIIIILLLCVVVIYRYRRKFGINLNNSGNVTMHGQGTTVERTDGIYDSIDESQIIDIPIYFENLSHENSEQSGGDCDCVSIGDGYIIPFNSVEDDNESQSLQHTLSSNSSSSSPKSHKMNIDYLNSYQPAESVSDHHSYSIALGSVNNSALLGDLKGAPGVVFSGEDINIYYSTNRPQKGSISPESNSGELHRKCLISISPESESVELLPNFNPTAEASAN